MTSETGRGDEGAAASVGGYSQLGFGLPGGHLGLAQPEMFFDFPPGRLNWALAIGAPATNGGTLVQEVAAHIGWGKGTATAM